MSRVRQGKGLMSRLYLVNSTRSSKRKHFFQIQTLFIGWKNLSWQLLSGILIISIVRARQWLWAHLIWGSMLDCFITVIHFLIKAPLNPWLETITIQKKKIKLICRLTKDRYQALISISTEQEFPARTFIKGRGISLV